MRKIVFFDIDGTLVDSFAGVKEMREDVKKSIKDLQAQGNYIFIATGRPYAFLSQEILNFGFDGFILANALIDSGKAYKKYQQLKELVIWF